MGIDEFKATSDTISKMAFIIVDQNKHNIFDINNSRLSLDIEKYFKRYSKCFRKEMTEKEIVTYLINTHETLYNDYQIYQGIDKSINTRNKDLFLNIVNNNRNNKNLSTKMCKTLKTYIDFIKYILNSFDYEYSNGMVEGMNNLIKQVKHSACGYRKFNHLKARVMLIKGLLNPIKVA